MAGLEVANRTTYAAQPLPMIDENGRETLTIVVKGTWRIAPDGRLAPSEEAVPVDVTGEHYGEPGVSSYRYEPEIAPLKVATDVVLVGHAWPEGASSTELDVGLRVGELQKIVRVFGPRVWVKSMGIDRITPPEPLEPTPLVYELAFGGIDISALEAEVPPVEMRNPVGSGYRDRKAGRFVEGRELPRIEDPTSLITDSKDAPAPAGFGFIGPHWQPRSSFAGTYDAAWTRARMPLLPEDFDRRFFNAAHPDLVAHGFLRGDEPVVVVNASKRGRLGFALPGAPPPAVTIRFGRRDDATPLMSLDTVIINTDDDLVMLLWRGVVEIPGQLHDIRTIDIA